MADQAWHRSNCNHVLQLAAEIRNIYGPMPSIGKNAGNALNRGHDASYRSTGYALVKAFAAENERQQDSSQSRHLEVLDSTRANCVKPHHPTEDNGNGFPDLDDSEVSFRPPLLHSCGVRLQQNPPPRQGASSGRKMSDSTPPFLPQ